MFRLPVCPCCGTVYRYGDVRGLTRMKQQECYHCHKTFTVSRRGWWLLGILIVALSVACNILIMTVFHNANAIVLWIVTCLWIAAAFFLRPFFITFQSNEQKKR